MSAIQNQQTSLSAFISINNTEVTNHNRRHSLNEIFATYDNESLGGRVKRFYKDNKVNLMMDFTYLPGSSLKTVDGRSGRDFLENLASTSPYVSVRYQDSPDQAVIEFNGFIQNYSEVIVRRDLPTQCTYYDVRMEIQEQ